MGEESSPASYKKSGGAPNSNGAADTFLVTGSLDPANPFFKSIGVNGRTCESCHQQAEGWTITPAGVQRRFNATDGNDPIFRLVDGASSPNAPVATVQDRAAAYALLRSKGLIRVGRPVPPGADYQLIEVDDPYHFASASEVSMFRRPLPTTNLRFLATIMWDGRESPNPADLVGNLTHQATGATLRHAEATSTDPAAISAIVNQEIPMHTAQISAGKANELDGAGARGGPEILAGQEFFLGINDPLGGNPRGTAFDPRVFTIFDAWASLGGNNSIETRTRKAIFRGQELFNTRAIDITGVKGLNDVLGQPSIKGTCTTCHDTPNVGNHSVPLMIDIGLVGESRRTPDLPLYTFQRISDGATIKVTDPGRGLITGKFADIGKFKGPILRALSARAPYFHNGSATTLRDVVDFYNTRFGIGLSFQDVDDLVAFLGAL